MFTIILLIIAFTLGYVYANATRNDTSQTSQTLRTITTTSRTITTTARTYTESSMQTPKLAYCYTCRMDRTVLATHKCVSHKYNSPSPPNVSTYRDRTYTLKELQYPAQIGDILLKLRYNQRVGYVNSAGLQLIENNGILADWGRSKGINGTTDKVIGETVEAAFSQDLALLDEYLDNRGVPPLTSNSVKLPHL
jgi:hypothetical protein